MTTADDNIAIAIDMFSDGGSQQSGAACACVIRMPQRNYKFVGYLGSATNVEAEIMGGLLGLSALYNLACQNNKLRVIWHCDNKTVLDIASTHLTKWIKQGWQTNAKEAAKHQGLWRSYLQLVAPFDISYQHVFSHQHVRFNEACDRACRWAIATAESKLQKNGNCHIGKNSIHNPAQAWYLLDLRDQLSQLRQFSPSLPFFTDPNLIIPQKAIQGVGTKP